VSLSKHDQEVDAFPSDRADQSLRVPILPWRPGRDRLVPNAHGAQPACDSGTVNLVLVADQIGQIIQLPAGRYRHQKRLRLLFDGQFSDLNRIRNQLD